MKNLIFILFITVTVSAFAQVPNYVPTNGLVGWWPFNGNANDESGNGNNGTVNGATLTTDRFGNANSAYSFDGQTNFIEATSNNDLSVTSNYSITAWLYVLDFNSPFPYESAIVSKIVNGNWYGGYEIKTNMSAGLSHTGNIGGSNFGVYSPTILNNNVWYNVTVTYDGNMVRLFQNGIKVDSISRTGSLQVSTLPLRFGRRGGAGSYNCYFNGEIDDIGIWNRALTQCEIQDLYNGQLNSGSGINAGIDQTVCQGNTVTLTGSGGSNYQWNNGLSNGVSFTPLTTQDYILSGEDVNGCLGTDTVTIEVLPNSSSSETVTECNSFIWGANNQTYTATGQYTEVLTNAVGCDSTVTLDLTITQPTTGSETVTECNSFTWGANNQTYSQSGQYTEVLTNSVGCDSTVTLDLTITQPTTGSETITECNSFTWGANNQTYTQSGQYTEVLTNVAGCDSTVTLDLTINSVDNGITQVDDFTLQANATGAAYQWIDCADESAVVGATNQQFAPAENGDYAVIVTKNGCSDTTECLSVSRLSILEHEQTLLVVYPNPATSMITIENPQGIASNYVVIDAQGRQVNAGKLQGETTSIDVAHIANGMYTITFEKNNLKDIKFIKK